MRLFRPFFLAGWIYPDALFRIETSDKLLFLTFDDGPDPVSTPVLLDILNKYGVKATFFCNGKAAEKYPSQINRLHEEGHVLGNHGYSHLDGWRTGTKAYTEDIYKASAFTSDKIFRPPYGRISFRQKKILSQSFKLVFWDLMPYDFDSQFGSRNSLIILKEKIRKGSVIVLHDTFSSSANNIIEEYIRFALKAGYRFSTIDIL